MLTVYKSLMPRGRVVFLSIGPPKLSDDGVDPLHKSPREEDCGHVVNRDGGKNRFDVSEPTSVIEFVGFDSRQLGSEFVDDKLISFISIIVVENNRMTKVQGIRKKIRDMEDVSDLSFGHGINTLAEENRRLVQVGGLAR